MAIKKFTYRGRTFEEIKEMPVDEFVKMLPSRERRSIARGFSHEEKKLLEKLQKKDVVKTRERQMVILPLMVGKEIQVHNGKEYVPVRITEEMLGKRLGEFALSRKVVTHSSPGVGASRSTIHQGKK